MALLKPRADDSLLVAVCADGGSREGSNDASAGDEREGAVDGADGGGRGGGNEAASHAHRSLGGVRSARVVRFSYQV